MTEQLKQKLNDSKVLRWSVLALVAFTMLCGYFLTDVMSPLKPMLEKELLWDSLDYGFFTSAYGWFNVFLLMLIFGGIILDKMGVRFTGMGACLLMVFGCGLKYYAVSTTFPEGALLFGFKMQVALAALGYAIFGVGVEIAGITVSKIIVKWFKGKEMALAMGLEMATARIGTTLAMVLTVPLADFFGSTDEAGAFHTNIPAPILFCLVMLCVGTIAFFIYTFYDKKLDASLDAQGLEPEEPFRMKDIVYIVTNKGFWLIALLCVLFYSCVFPFQKFASELMVGKYGIDENVAGSIVGLPALGALILTPVFGGLVDKRGKAASIMMLGAAMLICVHFIYAIPSIDNWLIAIGLMIILGIAFSLVPSAMWPSVAKIFPVNQLGTAYALIFFIQNIGLWGIPTLIGWVLDTYCVVGTSGNANEYDYTIPMCIFTGLATLSLFVAFLLKVVDKKKGYGLELPNIKK